MNGEERSYPYAPRWTVIVLGGLLFLLGAVVLGAKADANDRGVIINGIIELSPSGATAFYWVLCACSVGFVVASAALAYHRLRFRQRIVFGPVALIVPVSRWSRDEKEIAYEDIQALSTGHISGQRFLYITHTGGRHTIAASMLPSREAFEEVCALLAAKASGLERLVRGD